MRSQQNHNALRLIKGLILIFISVISLNISGVLWAGNLLNYGCPVTGTPFDAKLESIGFFNEPNVTAGSAGHTESVEKLFLIAKSFRYAHDSFNDRWQTVEETASKRSGDCKDKAVWLYAQLRRNGYHNTHLVIGKYRAKDSKLHAWVTCVDESGNAYLLDPAVQRAPKDLWGLSRTFYRPIYSFGSIDRMYSAYRFPLNF